MVKTQSQTDSAQVKRNIWKHHLKSWNSSGLSQAAYCRRHDLKVYDFQYWKKRLKPPQEQNNSSRLLPVTLTDSDPFEPKCDSSGISILINRYSVKIGVEFNQHTLSKLINMLEAR